VKLTEFIGSRRMGRSFAFEYQGHLYQAPVGYYANRQRWDFAPGYEHDTAPDLTRPITAECLFCHATGAEPAAGTLNRFPDLVHGIQCERCHGSGERHEQLVNPKRLAARQRDSICEQCHLAGEARVVQAGRRMADFRPGADLADFVEVMTRGSRGAAVNGHAEALAASRCKQMAGDRLWCGTCHDPHRPTVNYASICGSCHPKAHEKRASAFADCVSCHMPKKRAFDGGHTVFTDHSISIRSEQPLASYFGRQPTPRNLGLAYVALATKRKDSAYLDKAWPLLREAASTRPVDPVLYYTIANLLSVGGHKKEAIDYYRISIEQDPLQPDALLKLAAIVPSSEARELRQKAQRILPTPSP